MTVDGYDPPNPDEPWPTAETQAAMASDHRTPAGIQGRIVRAFAAWLTDRGYQVVRHRNGRADAVISPAEAADQYLARRGRIV